MKNFKRLGPGFALGLALALSSVAFAHNATQTTQTKTESCCSMACCKDGSCSMKDHAKKEHTKDHSAKDGCCGGGDSCKMTSHDSMKSHAAMEGCCCCKGDSCSINDAAKKHKTHQTKEHQDLKMDHVAMHPAAHSATHSEKDGCCCCSDSCDLKEKQDKAKG